MKRFALLILTFFVIVATVSASAHPGRTDSNGGHIDRSTGEYHYHHGYPAHQHTGGKCPYAFDDKTGQNSGSSKSSTDKKDSSTTVMSKAKADNSASAGTTSATEKQETAKTSNREIDWPSTFLLIIGTVAAAYVVSRLLLPSLQDDDFKKDHPTLTPIAWIICVPCWLASTPLLLLYYAADYSQRQYDRETEEIRLKNKEKLKNEIAELKNELSEKEKVIEELKTENLIKGRRNRK